MVEYPSKESSYGLCRARPVSYTHLDVYKRQAPATAVRCLLAIARGAELTEQLTTLAKTGLCALTEEEVCALENYAYTWSPNAAAWRAPFENCLLYTSRCV